MDVRLYFCAVPRVPTMASLPRAVALPKAAGSAEAPLRGLATLGAVCHRRWGWWNGCCRADPGPSM
jgi:hypothetical protein